jgi:glycerol-3-phosphate cytidylyltransferase-like family protein
MENFKFTTAVEASKIIDNLYKEARNLNYNKDIRKLIANAEYLVGVLGSAEVRARQLHKPYLANKPREELAKAIDYVEKMLLILRLTQ